MISNKTLATIFLITLNMQRAAASSSEGTQEPSLSKKPAPLVRKQRPAPKNVLKDGESTVKDVEVQGGSTGEVEISREQLAPQRKSGPSFFETLMSRGRYDRLCYFARRIGKDKFLKQLCPVVKTLEQYKGVAGYLNRHNLVASFYVRGNIFVVKEAIIAGSSIYKKYCYDSIGILEATLSLALKEDRHDRFIELLEVRKGLTVEKDELAKRRGSETSFERFSYEFLRILAPWEDGIAFKRFLTTRDEHRDKHPDILDTLCQELVRVLRSRHDEPKAKKMLTDLIGQPSILPPLAFVDGFLRCALYGEVLYFIDCAWSEIIGRCLRKEYKWVDDARLWEAIQKKFPTQFSGRYPDTEEAIAAVLVHFPTKQKLEDNWNKKF